jgi:two-component system NtrC family sensor kinase
VSETFNKKLVSFRSVRQWDGREPLEREISTYPITDDTDEVIQTILVEKDVTEKRRLEGFLAQSEKMAAVGELAAGIAHEINNPLTVIMANAQILQREIPVVNEDWQDSVDLIFRAGARALHSVRDLLNFARKEEFDLSTIDINDTIDRSLDMLKYEAASRSVKLVFEPGQNLPPVLGSFNHLQGVWLNLILNAMDAVGEEQGLIRITTYHQGNDTHVCVSDNGPGISPENLKRIFEPFFTTKDPDRGTGLGLSVCHRVIKQHGGLILVDSEIGKGTVFSVILPVATV